MSDFVSSDYKYYVQVLFSIYGNSNNRERDEALKTDRRALFRRFRFPPLSVEIPPLHQVSQANVELSVLQDVAQG